MKQTTGLYQHTKTSILARMLESVLDEYRADILFLLLSIQPLPHLHRILH